MNGVPKRADHLKILPVLLVASFICTFGSQAQSSTPIAPVEPQSCDLALGMSKTPEDILTAELETLSQLLRNDFFVTRNLSSYKIFLGPLFEDALNRLRNGETWVDMGAGLAVAMINYLNEQNQLLNAGQTAVKPNLIALSYSRPAKKHASAYGRRDRYYDFLRRVKQLDEMLEKFADHFRYLEGKKVEDFKIEKIAKPGSVKMITDLYGPLSYSTKVVSILTRYGKLLSEGGTLYIKVNHENLRFYDRDGKLLTIFDYVEKYCSGFRVDRFDGENAVLVRTNEPLKFKKVAVKSLAFGAPSLIDYQL